MASIDPLLVHLKENDGSDLHLVAGQPPRFRAKGSVRIMEGPGVLDDATLRAMMHEVATTRAWEEYETTGDLDFAFSLDGVARFRANYFVQQTRGGLRLPDHSRRDHLARGSESSPGGLRSRGSLRRARARDRADRFGQVDHAGGDHRQDQQDLLAPHRDDRGSRRVRPPEPELHCSRIARSDCIPRASVPPCAPPFARTPT